MNCENGSTCWELPGTCQVSFRFEYFAFYTFTEQLRRHLFFILNARIPKLTYVKFEKKLTLYMERWTSTCIKQAILKPFYTVVLLYLALNPIRTRAFVSLYVCMYV